MTSSFLKNFYLNFQILRLNLLKQIIHEETASLAKGYEAICAFVNADLGAPVIEELHQQGVN